MFDHAVAETKRFKQGQKPIRRKPIHRTAGDQGLLKRTVTEKQTCKIPRRPMSEPFDPNNSSNPRLKNSLEAFNPLTQTIPRTLFRFKTRRYRRQRNMVQTIMIFHLKDSKKRIVHGPSTQKVSSELSSWSFFPTLPAF